MKERGISFSTELVPRVLDGSKTQTRRVVRIKPYANEDHITLSPEESPHGVSGDRLWIKETWWCDDPAKAQDIMSRGEGLYWKATEPHPEIFPRWKSGRFMPKWASRPQRLEIVRVRAERVQDISDEDAKAEGVQLVNMEGWETDEQYRCAFRALWDNLNGKRAPWASNPWIWVIEFKLAGA